MNKVRNRIVLYAELSIFVLLTVLLTVVNVINFSMVSDDADLITARIAELGGTFAPDRIAAAPDAGGSEDKDTETPAENKLSRKPGDKPDTGTGRGRFGQMGPESAETDASMRYFTYAFDKEKNATLIAYKITSISEEDAEALARSLLKEKTGWTKGTYRYRVYKEDGIKYVTVIDQSRELLPSYRILIASVIGELVMLVLSLLILLSVSKRLFRPLAEADRKQKKFIANIEQDFKLPLTLINANTEIIERENAGSTEATQAINRQVKKMIALVNRLSALSLFDETGDGHPVNCSDLFRSVLDRHREEFDQKGIRLETDIADEIYLNTEEDALKRLYEELIDNSLKYAREYASFTMERYSNKLVLRQKNDTSLSNGSIDEIFDRFTRLENAQDAEGVGLGLSYVKDFVRLHNGRTLAFVENQVFALTIDI